MPDATCSIDGCESKALSRGWCNRHYLRWKAHGDPEYVKPPKPPCRECSKTAVARGLCETHYARMRRAGGLGRSCTIDGCDRPFFGRGWCEVHYDRWKSNGDPLVAQAVHGDPADRFRHYVEQRGPDECWPWKSTITHEGYGVMALGSVQVKAHRYAYELLVGPIPAGLDLDHTCHNADLTCTDPGACEHRRCCNPAHLEPVTTGENSARAHRHRAAVKAAVGSAS